MKTRMVRFSILTLLLLTAVIAVGLMLYQRHVAWLAAEAQFNEIIASDYIGDDSAAKAVQVAAQLVTRYPELVKRPGAMTFAVMHGDNDLCRQFLAAGADPNDPDSGAKHEPLFRPLTQDNAELVELLIAHGAEPKVRSGWFDDQRTYLHLAAAWESPAVCRVLVQHGFDINGADRDGLTPLHDAAQIAGTEVIETLLELGAKSKRDARGRTPYDIALTKSRRYSGLEAKQAAYMAVVQKLKALDDTAAE